MAVRRISSKSRPTSRQWLLQDLDGLVELGDVAVEVPHVGVLGDQAQQHLAPRPPIQIGRVRALQRLRLAHRLFEAVVRPSKLACGSVHIFRTISHVSPSRWSRRPMVPYS
jgi:hypothetical protein